MQTQQQPQTMRQNQVHPGADANPGGVIGSSPILWWALVVLIFAAGIGLRVYDLGDPPLDFHPTRQLHGYLIARGIYLQDRADVPQWQRDRALTQGITEGQIEPLVMERLTVAGYRLAGGERLWIPRALSILFWMLAALFLFLTCLRLMGRDGALIAVSFFLIWPYTVSASRSFQPDPLMIALIAAAWWAGDHWRAARRLAVAAREIAAVAHSEATSARASWGWALAAGVLAGLAIYVKTVAVFFIAPVLAVYILSVIERPIFKHLVSDRQAWLITLLAILPTAIYYLNGLVLQGFLVQQMSTRFYPAMWLEPAFYLRWIGEIDLTISFEAALVALLGVLLIAAPVQRAALAALWAGYVAYGLALPHHIGTHDYYQLPLFLLAAVGLGAAANLALSHLRGRPGLVRLAAVAVLLTGLVITGYEARNILKRSDYRAQAAMWQEAGARLEPQAAVTALVDDYGVGLRYWGWMMPTVWPTAADLRWQIENGQVLEFSQRFAELTAGKDYFLVSPLDELDSQPDLAAELDRYPLVYTAENIRVFDLRAAPQP